VSGKTAASPTSTEQPLSDSGFLTAAAHPDTPSISEVASIIIEGIVAKGKLKRSSATTEKQHVSCACLPRLAN